MYKIYMSEIKRLENYLKVLSSKIIPNKEIFDKILKIKKLIMLSKKNKSKILVFGNGGSAAIASHFSVDLTKNAKVSAMNFNEADLITCFANDYGHDNWMMEAIKKFKDPGDLIVLISSSGNSKNLIVAGNYCKKNKINLVTFTGFGGKNKLSKLGKINFWLNSKNYNQIEMVHQIWLLLACDFITSKKF